MSFLQSACLFSGVRCGAVWAQVVCCWKRHAGFQVTGRRRRFTFIFLLLPFSREGTIVFAALPPARLFVDVTLISFIHFLFYINTAETVRCAVKNKPSTMLNNSTTCRAKLYFQGFMVQKWSWTWTHSWIGTKIHWSWSQGWSFVHEIAVKLAHYFSVVMILS